jgi:protein-histidine N-methyltransferase
MDQPVTTSQTTHMVRGTWLSRYDGFPTYGLPPRLLSHLRAVLGCDFGGSTPEADVSIFSCNITERACHAFLCH